MNNPLINSYHFTAEWGGTRIEFTEISGLDITIDEISIRTGSSPEEHELKIPGIIRYPHVTFRRPIKRGDNEFFNWINTKTFGQVERRDIRIALLDEQHNPVFNWLLKNSFPVKYTGPVLVSNDSQVAMESITITHEGLKMITDK